MACHLLCSIPVKTEKHKTELHSKKCPHRACWRPHWHSFQLSLLTLHTIDALMLLSGTERKWHNRNNACLSQDIGLHSRHPYSMRRLSGGQARVESIFVLCKPSFMDSFPVLHPCLQHESLAAMTLLMSYKWPWMQAEGLQSEMTWTLSQTVRMLAVSLLSAYTDTSGNGNLHAKCHKYLIWTFALSAAFDATPAPTQRAAGVCVAKTSTACRLNWLHDSSCYIGCPPSRGETSSCSTDSACLSQIWLASPKRCDASSYTLYDEESLKGPPQNARIIFWRKFSLNCRAPCGKWCPDL